MQTIARDELKARIDRGDDTKVVEVLAENQYRQGHLPTAINVPLGEDFDSGIENAVPDKNQEVVVYCASKECTASPKAARRMDELGYKRVLDYEEGKADWREAGLPLVK
jgi:rhodanese-related sulfurtransferase